MKSFLDVYWESLNKEGEELCGDTVRAVRTKQSSVLVVSDGLGSGVKANILSTLTSQILVTMLKKNIALEHVIATVVSTLPVCKDQKLAYATFTVVQVNHDDFSFRINNFDNPPVMRFRHGKLLRLDRQLKQVAGKPIYVSSGTLEPGDFLGVLTDGILNAGSLFGFDPTWNWEHFAKHLESVFLRNGGTTRRLVHSVIQKTGELYKFGIRDDSTFLGAHLRQQKSLLVFTGPPLDSTKDNAYADRFVNFDGRKVICGGTTAEIIGNYIGERVETDPSTMSADVPPAGFLNGIDLVTEGILTMAKALEVMISCNGNIFQLEYGRDASYLLARELLDADSITFLLGQTVNPYYQNPQLPRSISIRRSLVDQIAQFLRSKNKEVVVELC